ncbi:MAG: glycine C-acetyltransferase [Alphaproteobacteria bacterium]|nr:glycine C-acetyltransferase [Alphaproteobacteria bacterium]
MSKAGTKPLTDFLKTELAALKDGGLYKAERIISTPQGAELSVAGAAGGELLNFCANNYLGLSSHPDLVAAAKAALDRWGYGVSSVRFICGTQTVHKILEAKLSTFLGQADTVLYSSCFDANTGLFETLLGDEDAVISDALNHASIIDGIRLCKAKRLVYANSDMAELEERLRCASASRIRLIVTDGVFSMDGSLANLPAICDLAERYDAMVMVDDSHGLGVLGPNGAGTPDHWGVRDRIDIVTGTLGKALGGASGGFTATGKEIAQWLRQRSRPYLFSNSVAPVIAATSLAALDLIQRDPDLRNRLADNAARFRAGMTDLGFDLIAGTHPIVPVMLGEAVLAQKMAACLFERGIYAVGFSYPVVPQGQARIRTQMSAAHTTDHIDLALEAFAAAGAELGVI